MKNGVHFDAAFSLDAEKVMAMGIIFGRFDGGEFDFANWCWKDR